MARILIVEDSKDVADMYAHYLRVKGFDVDVALDGTEGRKLLTSGRYDLGVLDLMMPGANGYQIAESLNGSMPLLLVTAHDDDPMVQMHARRAGFAGVLFKPVVLEEFLRKVKFLLAGGRDFNGRAALAPA